MAKIKLLSLIILLSVNNYLFGYNKKELNWKSIKDSIDSVYENLQEGRVDSSSLKIINCLITEKKIKKRKKIFYQLVLLRNQYFKLKSIEKKIENSEHNLVNLKRQLSASQKTIKEKKDTLYLDLKSYFILHKLYLEDSLEKDLSGKKAANLIKLLEEDRQIRQITNILSEFIFTSLNEQNRKINEKFNEFNDLVSNIREDYNNQLRDEILIIHQRLKELEISKSQSYNEYIVTLAKIYSFRKIRKS